MRVLRCTDTIRRSVRYWWSNRTPMHKRALAIGIAQSAMGGVDTRIDIINITIEELVRLDYELPAFRTLDEVAEQAHVAAEMELRERIAQRLDANQRQWLAQLLETDLPAWHTLYSPKAIGQRCITQVPRPGARSVDHRVTLTGDSLRQSIRYAWVNCFRALCHQTGGIAPRSSSSKPS